MKEVLEQEPIIDTDKNTYIVDKDLFWDFYNEVHAPAYNSFLKKHYNLEPEKFTTIEKVDASIDVDKLEKFNKTKPTFFIFRKEFYTYKITTGFNDIAVYLLSAEEIIEALNELYIQFGKEKPSLKKKFPKWLWS